MLNYSIYILYFILTLFFPVANFQRSCQLRDENSVKLKVFLDVDNLIETINRHLLKWEENEEREKIDNCHKWQLIKNKKKQNKNGILIIMIEKKYKKC